MSGAMVADVVGLAVYAWALWAAGALVCVLVALVQRLAGRPGR